MEKGTEEQMGCLRVKANEYKYERKDTRLKEQFINGINDDDMMTKIIRELTVFKRTNETTSKHILS